MRALAGCAAALSLAGCATQDAEGALEQGATQSCVPMAAPTDYACMVTFAELPALGALMIEYRTESEHIASVRGTWLADLTPNLAGASFVAMDAEGQCYFDTLAPRVCWRR